jgi:SAM-dependent methyltransferase
MEGTMSKNGKLTTYLELCAAFYDLDKPEAPDDALAFYTEYVKKAQPPILEPMCGTGRFLIPLLEQGYDIHGLDASPAMLEILRAKCKAEDLQPNVKLDFLSNLDIQSTYGLIFIPSASFCLMTDKNEAKSCLQKMYNALLPGGKLVFEVETLHAIGSYIGNWQGNAHICKDGAMILGSFLSLPPHNQIGTVVCKYELIKTNRIKTTEVEKLEVRMYDAFEIEQWLKEIGFINIQRIKPYNIKCAAIEQDETVIFECTKSN